MGQDSRSVVRRNAIAQEDELLCSHLWTDLYEGIYTDKHDPYLVHGTFFCKRCLQIRHKSWRRDRAKLSDEFLEGFNDSATPTV